ncbi:hypothetical protein [Psychroserpens mesophilus]|uniref:hypothetical protein n=1 Tax=Psychroserpens mesophilus TaxID=325473 RepID=UPI003D65FB10
MEEIKNYKLKDFLKQPTELILEYVEILRLLKPIETKYDIYNLKLKEVEFIKENLNLTNDETIIEIISMVQGYEDYVTPKWLTKILPSKVVQYLNAKKKRKVLNLRITEFFGLLNNVKNQLEQISKAEASSLTSEHTNIKWEQVNGSERLQKFGIYNTLDALADGDILKYDAIMNLEYSEVFTKLLMNKTNSDLQHEMQNIKTIKHN